MNIHPSPISDYLARALQDAGTIELRHSDGRRWMTGWYSDIDALLEEIQSRSTVGNLYTSLNAPKLRIPSNAMEGSAIRDKDVLRVSRLPFDFDPERPRKGIGASREELHRAYLLRGEVISTLTKLGWPMPLLAMSGNGYHAMYRAALPADPETKQMLWAIYTGMDKEFSTETVKFDPVVRNPGRIFRLYGTMNRKGPNTPDRPHRMAGCIVPREWRQVGRREVESLANYYARQMNPLKHAPRRDRSPVVASGRGDLRTLDIAGWFRAKGLYKRLLDKTKHAVSCPWVSEHSSEDHMMATDTIIWEPDGGWAGFHCSHAHCTGRGLLDVMQELGDVDRHCGKEWRRER